MRRRLSRAWRRGVVVPGLLFGAPTEGSRPVPLTITRAERDAIYEIVIPRLTAIGDVWLCVKRGEFADAKKMGREFAEELRLLEDLGWSETIDRDTVMLTVPADELARTVARLHRRAARSLGVYVSRPKHDEELAERDLAASETLASARHPLRLRTASTPCYAVRAAGSRRPRRFVVERSSCASDQRRRPRSASQRIEAASTVSSLPRDVEGQGRLAAGGRRGRRGLATRARGTGLLV